MTLKDFAREYSDESACEARLKEVREEHGIKCPQCGCEKHYWDKTNKRWVCSKCGHKTTLTSGTVMHGSKLPLSYWFMAIHLLTMTKNSFSAAEIQRQLGHKRYQPIWEMTHKLRDIMGQRDELYELKKIVELDEAFITADSESAREVKLSGGQYKRGAGSERKQKVLVMVESTETTPTKKNQKSRKMGHIKMKLIPNGTADTVSSLAVESIEGDASLITDDSSSHNSLQEHFVEVRKQVIKGKDAPKALPWVHIAISNLKSQLLNLHHGIKDTFLQLYLNEFCYKLNRNHFRTSLFERLLMIAVDYRPVFAHLPYK